MIYLKIDTKDIQAIVGAIPYIADGVKILEISELNGIRFTVDACKLPVAKGKNFIPQIKGAIKVIGVDNTCVTIKLHEIGTVNKLIPDIAAREMVKLFLNSSILKNWVIGDKPIAGIVAIDSAESIRLLLEPLKAILKLPLDINIKDFNICDGNIRVSAETK